MLYCISKSILHTASWSFTSLLVVKIKLQMSAMQNWSSVVIKPSPLFLKTVHAAELTPPWTAPFGLCIIEACSFPCATQDRKNLIHKFSILLQAEIYTSALFFKILQRQSILLRIEKNRHLIFYLSLQFFCYIAYAQTYTFHWIKILKYLCIRLQRSLKLISSQSNSFFHTHSHLITTINKIFTISPVLIWTSDL